MMLRSNGDSACISLLSSSNRFMISVACWRLSLSLSSSTRISRIVLFTQEEPFTAPKASSALLGSQRVIRSQMDLYQQQCILNGAITVLILQLGGKAINL
eukprot:TRINITY_DN2916_c0_g1_i8.p2 TRINITY_DN2916_c0_g1~~TRINITY_DN2916_c0_g1_i8.p2  ORF type:complete len:100 (+),score=5.13 TRINITY_DN2916_c0_g1_i8:1049-1348(+)